jgi:hypothetical protein
MKSFIYYFYVFKNFFKKKRNLSESLHPSKNEELLTINIKKKFIINSKNFDNFKKQNKFFGLANQQNFVFYNTTIELNGITDPYKMLDCRFPFAKNLFIIHCDSDFISYNLNSRNFPILENIYTNSHIYDFVISNNNWNIYTNITQKEYFRKKNVEIKSEKEFELLKSGEKDYQPFSEPRIYFMNELEIYEFIDSFHPQKLQTKKVQFELD